MSRVEQARRALVQRADAITGQLANSAWRPARSNLEGARNAMLRAAEELAGGPPAPQADPGRQLIRAKTMLALAGAHPSGGPLPWEAVAALLAGLLGQGWQGLANAPRNGQEVLVRTRSSTGRGARQYVASFMPGLDAWALFPGCAVGDEELDAWRPIPLGEE